MKCLHEQRPDTPDKSSEITVNDPWGIRGAKQPCIITRGDRRQPRRISVRRSRQEVSKSQREILLKCVVGAHRVCQHRRSVVCVNASTRRRYVAYLSLSIVGLVTALVFNGLSVMDGADYGQAWFGSAVDWVLSADLSVVAIAAVLFMFTEARRIGMTRVWILVALSMVTAMAFTFPLFLALRERHLGHVDRV